MGFPNTKHTRMVWPYFNSGQFKAHRLYLSRILNILAPCYTVYTPLPYAMCSLNISRVKISLISRFYVTLKYAEMKKIWPNSCEIVVTHGAEQRTRWVQDAGPGQCTLQNDAARMQKPTQKETKSNLFHIKDLYMLAFMSSGIDQS